MGAALNRWRLHLTPASDPEGYAFADRSQAWAVVASVPTTFSACGSKVTIVTIVTKAGLFPPSLLSRAGRKIASLAGLKRDAPSTRRFAPQAVRQSVEQSLRDLKTDYVDALLLHGCCARDISDELRSELAALKLSGKALRVGIATGAEAASPIAAAYADIADVLQVEGASLAMLNAGPTATVITHSIFGSRRGKDDPAARLCDALSANPAGVVLFSSCDPQHIRSNASVARSIASTLALESGVTAQR
jgi:hypothetical protein